VLFVAEGMMQRTEPGHSYILSKSFNIHAGARFPDDVAS
jgi:hypothetical protein